MTVAAGTFSLWELAWLMPLALLFCAIVVYVVLLAGGYFEEKK